MSITLSIPPDVVQEARAYAAENGEYDRHHHRRPKPNHVCKDLFHSSATCFCSVVYHDLLFPVHCQN